MVFMWNNSGSYILCRNDIFPWMNARDRGQTQICDVYVTQRVSVVRSTSHSNFVVIGPIASHHSCSPSTAHLSAANYSRPSSFWCLWWASPGSLGCLLWTRTVQSLPGCSLSSTPFRFVYCKVYMTLWCVACPVDWDWHNVFWCRAERYCTTE